MVTRTKKIIGAIIIATTLMLSLCACDSNAVGKLDLDNPVEIENVNKSNETVGRAFLEAVFTGNKDIFAKCFPASYDEDGIIDEMFDIYTSEEYVDGEFIGTAYKGFNFFTEEEGYPEDETKEDIALFHNVSKDDIDQIEICEIEVFFNIDDENKSTMVYVVVYEMDEQWFMYQFADANAEFKK